MPSGRSLVLSEILTDENPGELWLRLRFVAPDIRDAEEAERDRIAEDMDWLCENLARPYIDRHGLDPARVVISFSDRPVPFGKTAPDATQVFEAYRFENGQCVWEAF